MNTIRPNTCFEVEVQALSILPGNPIKSKKEKDFIQIK
jgi:hypothetical protein